MLDIRVDLNTLGPELVSTFVLDILKSNLTNLQGRSTNIIFIEEHNCIIATEECKTMLSVMHLFKEAKDETKFYNPCPQK